MPHSVAADWVLTPDKMGGVGVGGGWGVRATMDTESHQVLLMSSKIDMFKLGQE